MSRYEMCGCKAGYNGGNGWNTVGEGVSLEGAQFGGACAQCVVSAVVLMRLRSMTCIEGGVPIILCPSSGLRVAGATVAPIAVGQQVPVAATQ